MCRGAPGEDKEFLSKMTIYLRSQQDLKSLSCKEESYAFLSLAIRPVLIPTREKEGIVKDSAHIRVTQYPAAPSRVGRANRLTIDLS